MRPWLSVIGLYNYDNTIFDDLKLPLKAELRQDLTLLSTSELDKNLLIGKILMDLGELSLIYTEPETVKGLIEIWSKVNHDNWLALWETLLYKYNPIWNKDGTYTENRSLNVTGQQADTTSGSVQTSGTDARTTTTDQDTTNHNTVAHAVTGYDTNSYSPDTQDSENGSGTNDVTVTEAGNMQQTTGSSGSLNRSTGGTEQEAITRVEQGNIGVTTSQQMIREQREIVLFNLYEFITESFKKQFCLMVY